MKLEDRYYSESELRGKNSENPEEDKLYSQQEVLEISDLFDEFYSEHGDTYSDVDEAYDEFIEAYSNVGDEYADPIMINENPKQEAPKKRKNISIKDPRITKTIAGTAGAGAGLALSKILTRKDIAEKKSIEEKMSKGLASVKDIERLEKIKRKIRAKVAASTVGGAALGVGGVHLYGKYKNKNYSDDSYAQFIGSKKKLKDSIAKNRYSNHKNAAIGALAGTATGLLAAKLTDKGSARRKELKAKISSGNASPQETKEYAEAKKKARKRMAIAGGAGLATGAAAGYNTNRVKGAYKSLKEVDRSEFKLKKFKNKKHRSNFMKLAKGAAFNGHLHGGKSTNELMDTVKK
jgi:hypothetical protein